MTTSSKHIQMLFMTHKVAVVEFFEEPWGEILVINALEVSLCTPPARKVQKT